MMVYLDVLTMNSDPDSILFERPAVNTDAYKFSFLPHAISTWNALPPDIQNSSSLYSIHNYMGTLSMLA